MELSLTPKGTELTPKFDRGKQEAGEEGGSAAGNH